MSYLRFDKTLMTNLEESLQREILRTNKAGAYHCTTIVDCNTRKYHGLLVIPVPNIDDENHVLLSSLDETVIQHGAEFNLGLHKYQGNNFSPNGHKYIREFDCEHIPATTYRVGGVVLRKEKIFVHHEKDNPDSLYFVGRTFGDDFALPTVPRFPERARVHSRECAGKPRLSACGKWYQDLYVSRLSGTVHAVEQGL